MSDYAVAKLCRDCLRDPQLRRRVAENPARALDGFDLTVAERDALLAGDVAALYLLGSSAFLMSYLPRWGLFQLDTDTYSSRMRAVIE